MSTKLNIEELASKIASRYTHRSAPLESVWTFTNRTLADFEKALRAEVLEKAAQKCEAQIDGDKEAELLQKSHDLDGKDGELNALKFHSTVASINLAHKRDAEAIRAMKPTQTAQQSGSQSG